MTSPAAPVPDRPAWLAVDGLQEAVLSVFDVERIARALAEVGGYRLQPLPDADRAQFAAWQVPSTCTRIEQALLVPEPGGPAPGCLRLVRFDGVAQQRVMRSSQRSWDTGGIFDVDVYARDVDSSYRALQRHGWTAFGEPVEYREAEFHVRQVVAVGPDGLVLAIIQRFSPPVPALDADPALRMTPVFNSTQMVRDFERAARFSEQVLGWRKSHDFLVDAVAEPGADVLGLPLPQAITARRRVGIFHPADAQDGSIELIENASMYGRDCAADCVAPNVGLLALRFRVADAAGYAREILARGGELHGAPARFEVAPYGSVTTFAVRSPEGAIVEFIQPG
ncbi:MAG: hypothetical protein U1F11_00250 [Steroidobacteraceae bacterium]